MPTPPCCRYARLSGRGAADWREDRLPNKLGMIASLAAGRDLRAKSPRDFGFGLVAPLDIRQVAGRQGFFYSPLVKQGKGLLNLGALQTEICRGQQGPDRKL